MNQAALQQEVVIRDISREPRVSRKGAPKKMTHTVALIPPNYVQILWHEVKDYLGPAIARSRGRWDMEALYNALVGADQYLWVAFNKDKEIEGVGTTEFVMYPSRKMMAIQYLGGRNFNSWVWEMLEKFNGWAKDNECDGIEATARHGFWKWLEQDDFERSYTVFEKGLEL